jgi:putative oxidoreductase
VQRLFSMFPDGWPGIGLLLLRLVSGAVLIQQGLIAPRSVPIQPVAALAGAFLTAGLWTPVAGALVIACELWIALAGADEFRTSALVGTIGVALAMLGPGSTSLDNLIYGRKRFDIHNT